MFFSTQIKLLGCILLAAACYGDTIVFENSSAALGANDSVVWSQLGSDGTVIPHAYSAISVGGKPISGTYAGTTGLVAVACPAVPSCSWGPVVGIAAGDYLDWSFDGSSGLGTGPDTFTVPTGFGVGAIISADVQAGTMYTARLELFNGNTSLGFVTQSSDANGDAFFLGALDTTGPNVNKAVFSLTAINGGGDLGDFALDTLSLKNQVVTGIPEPATCFLMGAALLAFGWKLKRRT